VITAEQARAVADLGGVVGVWWRLFDTVTDYVTGIRARVEALGVDHVGIGTDSDLTASYVLPYINQIWPDENGGFVHAVVGEMLKQGFSADEIGKVCGGNFCRVFGQVTATRA
jgi:membrane dipeptidase